MADQFHESNNVLRVRNKIRERRILRMRRRRRIGSLRENSTVKRGKKKNSSDSGSFSGWCCNNNNSEESTCEMGEREFSICRGDIGCVCELSSSFSIKETDSERSSKSDTGGESRI